MYYDSSKVAPKNYTPYWTNLVGFEEILSILDANSHTKKQSYPPHNIVKIDEENYNIELAVAGFSKKDIKVTVEDKELLIVGEQLDKKKPEYVHQGISEKKFTSKFKLAADVKVVGATCVDGILIVELKRIVPEELKPRNIPIW
jgi:molecular chaperone IbpA